MKTSLFEFQRRAHKLAGRGGTFGYPELSEVARTMETEMDRIIRSESPVNSQEVDRIAEMISAVEGAVTSMD